MIFNGTWDATSPIAGGSTASAVPVRGHFARAWVVPLVAALALGCDDDKPLPPDPPPDLSGTYDIVSLTRGGFEFVPPVVAGTFMLTQDSVAGSQAFGTMAVEVVVEAPPFELVDEGIYTNSLDGAWTQAGELTESAGTYTFGNDTLAVSLTAPASAASESVWERR